MPLRAGRAGREARAKLRRLYRPRGGVGAALSDTIRVAHLLPTLEIGGKERSVIDLCAAAAGQGIAPLIVTYDRVPPDRQTLDAGVAARIALDRRDPSFATALRQMLADARVDLLHAHGHVAGVYAAPAAATVASVATIHAALGQGWRWLPAIVPALRRMDRILAVSDDLAGATRRITLRSVATIATGVDAERFHPSNGSRQHEELLFGIAARLHPVKRHGDLLAAMTILAARNMPLRLLVAGDGPLDRPLRAAAPGNVTFLGPVADMPAFYHGLDGFLLCSDHEGLPLALLEAMASGLPCIATRVGGMIALIGDGSQGVLGVPRRDPLALADALTRLAADAGLREIMSREARVASLSRSIAAQSKRYAEVYRTVLSNRRLPP